MKKCWEVYEELRDSYIIDGVSRKKAEVYAKKDYRNSDAKVIDIELI